MKFEVLARELAAGWQESAQAEESQPYRGRDDAVETNGIDVRVVLVFQRLSAR